MVRIIIYLRIPVHLKNRLTRKQDEVDFKLEDIYGVIQYTSFNVHKYEIPNNHYRNVFNNICPEDLSIFFGIQNSNQNQDLYIKVMASSVKDLVDHQDKTHRHTPDEIIKEALVEENFNLSHRTYNYAKYILTPIALLSGAAAAI